VSLIDAVREAVTASGLYHGLDGGTAEAMATEVCESIQSGGYGGGTHYVHAPGTEVRDGDLERDLVEVGAGDAAEKHGVHRSTVYRAARRRRVRSRGLR